MVSVNAPIDRVGSGGDLSVEARAGQRVFERDCAACHKGPDFTDDRFHRVADLPPGGADRGFAEVTGRRADEGKFRTPSLRNVALSAPYFHDGGSPTIGDAIRRHAGVTLTPGEERAIAGFLDLMTDRTFVTDPRFAYPDGPCEV